MADEPENITIRLLQEMRESMARLEARLDDGLGGLDERITNLVQRINGNTLVFNPVAGVVHDHEERIVTLEEGRA